MARAEHLRPSGAATWVVCTGSVAFRAAFPDAPDEADDEVCEDGTACHWLASEIWEGRTPAIDSLSPNNRVLDSDMFDAVDMYHGVLRSKSWQAGEVYVEQPVSCDVIYPGMKGTPDAWTYSPGWLRVADLKYGFRFVEAWDNWQMIVYVLSLAHMLKLPMDTMVEMTIVQPRNYHRDGPVRSWRVGLQALQYKQQVLQQKAAEAMADYPSQPLCTPNPGCGDCPGRHACHALQAASMAALETSRRGVPLELQPAALGMELMMLKDAEKKIAARISGLETQADSLLRRGQVIPGWMLAPTYARETWKPETEAQVLTLGNLYNVNVSKPQRAITPAQARKVLPPSLVAVYAHKPSTGMKLVKIDPYEAHKKFSQPQ